MQFPDINEQENDSNSKIDRQFVLKNLLKSRRSNLVAVK